MMIPDDINALIDAYSQPITDENQTKPPSEIQEEDKVDFHVLFLRRAHSPDRPPLDSNPLLTDYEARTLTNAPPGISVDEEEYFGLTCNRLATIVRMANQLQRAAQEWDPLMFCSLNFSSVVEGGISVYKNLLAQRTKNITSNYVLHSEKDYCTVAISGKRSYGGAAPARRKRNR